MLAIRMQRRGRRGHAQFRLVVQDSRFSPSSGRVVAHLGSYDPHTKVASFDKDKTAQYLKNGAQPSDRAARLLKKEGVKLPSWVKIDKPGKRTIRHPEKLRKNRPAEAAAAEPENQPAQEPEADVPAEDQPVEEAPAPETEPVEEPAPEPDAGQPEAAADKS